MSAPLALTGAAQHKSLDLAFGIRARNTCQWNRLVASYGHRPTNCKVPNMSLPVEALELEVLRLPAAERERLLDRVIASLDADKARDKAWDNLAAKRDSEIERGESTPVSGPEVVARLRVELS